MTIRWAEGSALSDSGQGKAQPVRRQREWGSVERWADCRKGYQNKYVGGTDLHSETCISLILLNIGASLGHSQEKHNAKRSVPSLHIRHKVFLVLLLTRNTVSLRRGKKLQIKVKRTLVPFSGTSKWQAWMVLSLAYAVKTGYQTGRLGTMWGHPETTRTLEWFLFNFHPTGCYKPITFL